MGWAWKVGAGAQVTEIAVGHQGRLLPSGRQQRGFQVDVKSVAIWVVQVGQYRRVLHWRCTPACEGERMSL